MRDFVAAWDKVMNLDRFDLKAAAPTGASVKDVTAGYAERYRGHRDH